MQVLTSDWHGIELSLEGAVNKLVEELVAGHVEGFLEILERGIHPPAAEVGMYGI